MLRGWNIWIKLICLASSFIGGAALADKYGPDHPSSDNLASCVNERLAAQERIRACSRAEAHSDMVVDRAAAQVELGELYRRIGQFQTSIDTLSDFLSGSFSRWQDLRTKRLLYVHAYTERGVSYALIGNYGLALADANQAIKSAQHLYAGLGSRCWIRAVAGKELDLALDDCTRSLALQPDRASVLDSRALVYLKSACFSEAITDSTAALKIDPKIASSYYVRGIAKRQIGDERGGDDDLAMAHSLQPDIEREYEMLGVSTK